MKKMMFFLIIAVLVVPGLSLAETCTDCCDDIEQIMDNAAEEYRGMTQDIMTTYIKEPETVSLEDCLASINALDFGFSLSLPSLDDLLGMACDFVRETMEDQIFEMTGEIGSKYSFSAYGIEGSVESGRGSDGNSDINVDYSVNDYSEQIVDEIWNSVND